ncbi:hypothetical protein PANDA_022151 [Ailuropoda melanoleuca]|uniref:N-terminal Ras-GEF domain-containing protein n=1 Tax=Ailuropoda melanoleuca TaxID=9646 RepID=D2I806_AILME|nr:hypothetical protein PANDA_022151 [Ailuropoda melanoleuca]
MLMCPQSLALSRQEHREVPLGRKPKAISSILATWLGHYPEYFFQPPEFPCLKALLAYVWCNVLGSDLEQCAWLLLSWLRHLKPAELEAGGWNQSLMAAQSSTQETGQELNDGIPCPTSFKDRKESPTANKVQCRLGARKASTRKSNGTCVVRPQWAELLKKLVEPLLPAFLDGDLSYVSTFLTTYRDFATTEEVLDQLLTSYGCVLSSWDEIGGAQEQRGM